MTLPIDRTAKSTLDTNLVNGNTSDAPVIKSSNDTVYNTIDELYNFALALIASGNVLYLKTTANLTYYVNTTGNDNNNGTSSGTPFKTIGKAISMIPQIVNHTVIINVALGTYPEAVAIQGYSGIGNVQLLGGVSLVDAANFHIKNLAVIQNGLRVLIRGFDLTDATVISMDVSACRRVEFQYITSTVAATSKYGLFSNFSTVAIDNSTISNRFVAISAQNGSIIYTNSNSGSGSTNGLESTSASKIGKNGSQPTGTTPEVISNGGTIS